MNGKKEKIAWRVNHPQTPISNRLLTDHKFVRLTEEEEKTEENCLIYERKFASNFSIVLKLVREQGFNFRNCTRGEWQVFRKFNGIVFPVGIAKQFKEFNDMIKKVTGTPLARPKRIKGFK